MTRIHWTLENEFRRQLVSLDEYLRLARLRLNLFKDPEERYYVDTVTHVICYAHEMISKAHYQVDEALDAHILEIEMLTKRIQELEVEIKSLRQNAVLPELIE